MPETLSLTVIRTDGGTQPRAQLDLIVIAEYAEAMKSGATFPPVVVFNDGESYWLADGFHRLEASRQAGLSAITADVRQGTRRDAVLYSVGANATHGLRRSNADKRRAVQTLLRDPEWQQWSDHEIARKCAVDHKTVGRIRAELAATGEIPQSDLRRGADGRVIHTANIGSKSAPAAQRFPLTETVVATAPIAVEGDAAPQPGTPQPAAPDPQPAAKPMPERRPVPTTATASPPALQMPPAPTPDPAPKPVPEMRPATPPATLITIRIQPGEVLAERRVMASIGAEGQMPAKLTAGTYSTLLEIVEELCITYFEEATNG